MPAKRLVVELLNASGEPVPSVTVKVTGCGELQTAPNGRTLFLVEDENVTVWVNGQEAHKGALAALPAQLTFKQNGGGWTA